MYTLSSGPKYASFHQEGLFFLQFLVIRLSASPFSPYVLCILFFLISKRLYSYTCFFSGSGIWIEVWLLFSALNRHLNFLNVYSLQLFLSRELCYDLLCRIFHLILLAVLDVVSGDRCLTLYLLIHSPSPIKVFHVTMIYKNQLIVGCL